MHDSSLSSVLVPQMWPFPVSHSACTGMWLRTRSVAQHAVPNIGLQKAAHEVLTAAFCAPAQDMTGRNGIEA